MVSLEGFLLIIWIFLMQKNIDDFFCLNGRNSASQASNMNTNSNPASQNSQNSTNLRLPHHTKRLWQFAKGLLMLIATKQSCTVETIIGTIYKLIVECRILRDSEVEISTLNEYFRLYESDELLNVFSKIASYALEVEMLFPVVSNNQPIPISSKYSNLSITLSSSQIRCLLALQFICCFPKQERVFDLPNDYTYAKVFNKSHADTEAQITKIQCAMNYFIRQEQPTLYYVTFIRKSLRNFPN